MGLTVAIGRQDFGHRLHNKDLRAYDNIGNNDLGGALEIKERTQDRPSSAGSQDVCLPSPKKNSLSPHGWETG